MQRIRKDIAKMNKQGKKKAVVFNQWCLRHVSHLMVKKALARKQRYYRFLAKLVNIWRASTNSVKIFDVALSILKDKKKIGSEYSDKNSSLDLELF